MFSGNGRVKVSPSKKLVNTDVEEALANAEGRKGCGQSNGKDFVSSTVVWLEVVGDQEEQQEGQYKFKERKLADSCIKTSVFENETEMNLEMWKKSY